MPTNRFSSEIVDATLKHGTISYAHAHILWCRQEYRMCVITPAMMDTLVTTSISRRWFWSADPSFWQRRYTNAHKFLRLQCTSIHRANSKKMFRYDTYGRRQGESLYGGRGLCSLMGSSGKAPNLESSEAEPLKLTRLCFTHQFQRNFCIVASI